MTAPPAPFRYESFELDPAAGLLTCRYSLGDRQFAERVSFDPAGRWDDPRAAEAARLVFLLAGVSYYKTAAPPVIDLGDTAVTDAERRFLRSFYLDGLAEFGYRNGLDLSGLRIEGPARAEAPRQAAQAGQAGDWRSASPVRPLVPFGGGIDSIVTVEHVRGRGDSLAADRQRVGCRGVVPPAVDTALFIMSRPGNRFDAIEAPAAVTGLPIVRAGREIDPQLMRSRELGFLNGHVPVTGILSAIAVMAAVLDGRDAVVMSNEWSASIPTLEVDGRPVNHQYSKSAAFEAAFRGVLAGVGGVSYFSALRPFTELWVAQRFAGLTQYHGTFRSCNRAFHLDESLRLDHWCGRCDKCCFIDLILAPFLPAAALSEIFGGLEPLADPDPQESLADKFRALLGTLPDSKPFECVGEIGECRAAALLAAQRPDRAGTPLLQQLAAEVAVLPDASLLPEPAELLRPIGDHFIPDRYAPQDLLV
jgi:UDP-N-acetyl-alpha-D-muramoyl-L-alanyl-L-glutamate epimerase